jgi:glycosyltransferase involved in cell wall biosynthesis
MLGLARHLPKFKWDVVVVAPPTTKHEPRDADLEALVPPGLAQYRPEFPEGSRLGSIAWMMRAIKASAEAVATHKPSAVITSTPPHALQWLGRYLQVRHGLKWVADFRDPWFTEAWGRRPSAMDRFGESMVLARCDAIVANTDGLAKALVSAAPAARMRIHSIPNGFDPDFFPSDQPSGSGFAGLDLLHAGDIYGGRDPRALFGGLSEVRGLAPGLDIRLRLMGLYDEAVEQLKPEIARLGLSDIVMFEDRVSYRRSLVEMRRSDVLVALHIAGRRASVPAKCYEYIGACRPILALAEPYSEVADLLRSAGADAEIVSPTDQPGIVQAILGFGRRRREAATAPSLPSEALAYTRESMAKRFADVLNRL